MQMATVEFKPQLRFANNRTNSTEDDDDEDCWCPNSTEVEEEEEDVEDGPHESPPPPPQEEQTIEDIMAQLPEDLRQKVKNAIWVDNMLNQIIDESTDDKFARVKLQDELNANLSTDPPPIQRKCTLLAADVPSQRKYYQKCCENGCHCEFYGGSNATGTTVDDPFVGLSESSLPTSKAVTPAALPSVVLEPLYDPLEFNATNNISDTGQDAAWTMELFQRLDRIRAVCGSVCTNSQSPEAWMTHSVAIPDANLRLTLALDLEANCPALMANADIDAGDPTVPFPPPTKLHPHYNMGGGGNLVFYKRRVDVYLGGQALQNKWTQEHINTLIQIYQQETVTLTPDQQQYAPTYDIAVTKILKEKFISIGIATKQRVLVIGSEKPWVEAICLAMGAQHVTTLEYGSIVSEHPQISTMTPNEMRDLYAKGELAKFDVVVSWSSLEHSGLGRYGDALNPWGDLLAVARAWCMTTDDAHLVLNVPCGQDLIWFNLHRYYGKMRYSLLTTNWIQLDGAEHPPNYFDVGNKDNNYIAFTFRKVTDFSPYLDKLGQ